MTDKLLPCPFCGGNPEHMSTSSSWIRCEDCGAEIQCRETKEDAVQMWNRRALSVPAPSGGGVEVLGQEACASLVEELLTQPAFNAHKRTKLALTIVARAIRRGRHLSSHEKLENIKMFCAGEGE